MIYSYLGAYANLSVIRLYREDMKGSFGKPKSVPPSKKTDGLISLEEIERSEIVSVNHIAIILLMLYFIIGISFYTFNEKYTVIESVCKFRCWCS